MWKADVNIQRVISKETPAFLGFEAGGNGWM